MDEEIIEETQEQSEVTPPIETTDYKAEVEKLKEENLKFQQAATRNANRANKYEKQLETVELLRQKQEDAEIAQAHMMDILEEIRGETTETPRRTSHVEELQKKREQAPKVQEVPGAVKFARLVEEKGLTMDSPIVAKAIAGTDTADEAIAKLESIMRDETDSKVQKRIEDEVKTRVAQALKDMGVAKSEGSPSGASQNDAAFIQSYSEGKSDDHARAKKIMNM